MSFRLRVIALSPEAEDVVRRLKGPEPDEIARRFRREFGGALRARLIGHVYSGDKYLLRQSSPTPTPGGRPLEHALASILFETGLTDVSGVVDVHAASVSALSDIFGGRADVYEAFVRVYAPKAVEDVLREAGLDEAAGGIECEIALSPEVRAGFAPAAAEAPRRRFWPAAALLLALVAAPLLAISLVRSGQPEVVSAPVAAPRIAAAPAPSGAGPEPRPGTEPGAPAAEDQDEPEEASAPAPAVVRGPPKRDKPA